METPSGRSGATEFVVHVEDRCTPALTGGYEGCEMDVHVRSLKAAQALAGALLDSNHTDRLKEDEEYLRPRAGGQRSVTVRRTR